MKKRIVILLSAMLALLLAACSGGEQNRAYSAPIPAIGFGNGAADKPRAKRRSERRKQPGDGNLICDKRRQYPDRILLGYGNRRRGYGGRAPAASR